MFEDHRSKKLVLVSHCLLNQNAISDGTADLPGTFSDVIQVLMKYNVGIIQLPCPELICLGLDRGDQQGCTREVIVENTRIRHQLLTHHSQNKISNLIDSLMYQIREYLNNGFMIIGIIGVNRSPSCGVETTSDENQEQSGQGVFMQQLITRLQQENIVIPMLGIKTSQPEQAVQKVESLFNLENC
ncbi:CD3072 family TudS-related putative desulfidase [Celerinatantimonas sp. YJH-8]|uniref:CD3072 family TudS-related putative desulfidase n=1 Tax=Celerinatantimonas sp. YJH-8 TaxID=3228714 RepID=UPI0038C62149